MSRPISSHRPLNTCILNLAVLQNWLNRSLLADASADRANFVAEGLKVLAGAVHRGIYS